MKNKAMDAADAISAEIAELKKELRETRQRLHECEERFGNLFSTATTGIGVSTPDGRFLQTNAAYRDMLGYTEEEMRALNFASLTHPDDVVHNLELRDSVLAGERDHFVMEKRYLKKGGDIVWARVGVSATRAPGGDITTLMVISEDITERKRTVDALRHSEERLRLITNLVPLGIFAKDASGRHIFANPALAEFAGLSVDEILGKDDFDLVTDRAQAETYRANDLAVIQSGSKMVILEEPRTDLSGRTRLLRTIKIPFTVAQTGEPAVLGVCSDITEQKRTEARFRRLVDSNVQGVFFWNTNGAATGANDAFLRMVGYTREDLDAGRIRWVDMTPPELVDQDQRALRELAEKGVCEPYEKEFIRRDGSRVPIFIGPAMFEDNRDEGFCFVLDLSERKKLEQQFLRAQRVESIGTLAGGIAHDLNNILAPIMLSVGLLKSESDTPKIRAILKVVADSAQRGADIVGQVLSFARGLEGRRAAVKPSLLFKELENIIKDTFPKDIQISFSVPPDAWTLFGDPTQMHQILLNLCLNARDAMPDGGTLSISAENQILDEHDARLNNRPKAKAGRYVCISVTDSGTGISREIIHRIFEPFFTTKQLNKGTGLGLSTVMAIVKSHEGIANVHSEPGKGTTFDIHLPAMEFSEGRSNQTPQISMPQGNGETILVVDDETSILAITAQTLEHFGYRVLSASDGAEAVAIYADKKHEIAIVLTDMMMPIMGGPSLVSVLLRINPAIRIIRSSGLSSDGDGKRSSEAEVKHFLTKPYTAETLIKTIRAVLDEDG